MSEMIDRVSLALARYHGDDVGSVKNQHYQDMARAAIEAMREPTQEMMAGVDCAGEKAEWLSGKAWKAGYHAMIDSALK